MSRFFKKGVPLRSQFLMILLIFSLGSLFLSTYLFTRDHLKYTHEHIERELNTLVLMTQGALNRTFKFRVEDALYEVLEEVNGHHNVEYAAILSTEGKPLYKEANRELPHNLRQTLNGPSPQNQTELKQSWFAHCYQNMSLNIVLSENGQSLVACAPVVTGFDEQARASYAVLVIEYAFPLTATDAFIHQIPKLVAWLTGVFSVLIFFFWYLNKQVVRPVKNLVSNMQSSSKQEQIGLQKISGAAEFIAIDDALREMLFERDLREAEFKKLSTAVEQSKEGVLITDSEGNIEYVNQAVIDITGYSKEELLGQNPRILSSGKTDPEVFVTMWATLLAGNAWSGELYNRRADGTEIIELQTITPLQIGAAQTTHYVSVRQDITAQKSTQERLHFLAYFDPLTHLPNRVQVLQKLKKQVERSRKSEAYSAFFLLNIDRLRIINDGRGYDFGNRVIVALSERLLALEGDLKLGQLGGDNFCLIKEFQSSQKESLKRAVVFAKRLKAACSEPLYVEEEDVTLSVSIGICLIDGFVEAEQIIRRAETALHRAKENGGNQCFMYQDEHGKQAEYIFNLESELREALVKDQLRCYLQAQINPMGKVAGAEALMRWEHPERGLVSPADFIPIAERTGLIIELDQWMLKTALKQLVKWQKNGCTYKISVNISPRFLQSPEFATQVESHIQNSQAPADKLVLEVTEGIVIQDIESTIAKMNQLRKLGVEFAIDDFGTGYSSLSYLQKLPIQELKIDQSFIRGIPKVSADLLMVESIIGVAQNTGLRVVAEGIETNTQAEFCLARGVWGQGYFYGRPQPISEWCSINGC